MSKKKEVIDPEMDELEESVKKLIDEQSTLVSEILKRNGTPITDMTAMERLEQLHKHEQESSDWKKMTFLLAGDLRDLLEEYKKDVQENKDHIIALCEASLDRFRKIRLGIDESVE